MSASGRIGPNAITQCMAAMQAALGNDACAVLMQRCGLHGHVLSPPQQMVDEADVVALHRGLRAELGVARARALARIAGSTTGDYLLAHRIPRLAQAVLKVLPAPLAARVLLSAIGGHAWTFCGSGRFSIRHRGAGKTLRLSIAGSAVCRGERSEQPLCDYYAATFERLFGVLVHPRTVVREVECEAMGTPACVFEVVW